MDLHVVLDRTMTFSYNLFFVCVWGCVTLTVPLAITCFVWATLDKEYGVGYGIGVASLLYTVLMRFHGSRVLVRSGAWPSWFCGDYYPRNEEELRQACKDCIKKYKRSPSIVGAGWAYFLWRQGARKPRLFLYKFKGLVNGKEDSLLPKSERWASGTTITAVNDYYEKLKFQGNEGGPVKGYTLSTHPTMDYISLGSWFACGNHGNGGGKALGSSETMHMARVLDMRDDSIDTCTYEQVRQRFDSCDATNFCIIDISFKNLVPNKMVQKRALKVNNVQTANEWLDDTSYLRVLFQGAARDYSLGLQWKDVYSETDHVDPHCCSVFSQWVQADVCSAWMGCLEPLTSFQGKSYYRDANRWIPALLPLMETYIVLRGYRNFEVVFRPGHIVSGVYLDCLTRKLRQLHEEVGGRSEIRYGTSSADQVLFLDCVFTNKFGRVFEMLHSIGVTEVALHPGKHHPETNPCNRVTLASVYGFSKTVTPPVC